MSEKQDKSYEDYLLDQMDEQNSHLKSLASDFVKNFVEDYTHKNIKGFQTHYKHEIDAEAFRAQPMGNFWVTFSIPNNKDTVVCSFWGMETNEYGGTSKRKVQIDLVKTMKHVIEHHYNHTHQPMPKYEETERDMFQ